MKPQTSLFNTLREAAGACDFRTEQTVREHFTVGEPTAEGVLQFRVLTEGSLMAG